MTAEDRRRAIVTGASQGLGELLAQFLGDEHYELLLTARRREPLERVAERLRRRGAAVEVLPGDVTDAAHRRAVAERLGPAGRLDLLVNNASELGPSPLRPLTELPLESFRRILEVNVVAPLALIQELAPALARGHGRVVNITSDAAIEGYAGWGGYGASKAALDLVSRTLAGELRTAGISVVSVDPGDLRTAMHQAAYPGQDISDRPLPEVTVPFWAWLLHRDPAAVTGRRYRAQSDRWEVAG